MSLVIEMYVRIIHARQQKTAVITMSIMVLSVILSFSYEKVN